MEPAAPKLNSIIKIHKGNNSIWPVNNSIQATSYQLDRFVGRKLCELTELPYTYIFNKEFKRVGTGTDYYPSYKPPHNDYFSRQRFACKSSHAGYIKDQNFLVPKKKLPQSSRKKLGNFNVILNHNYFQKWYSHGVTYFRSRCRTVLITIWRIIKWALVGKWRNSIL
jgi:hypothetical protein